MKHSSVEALTAFAFVLLLTAPSFAGNTSPYRTVAVNTSSAVPGSALPLLLRPSTNVLDKSVRTQAGSHFQSISQLQDAQKAAQEAAQK